MSNIRYDSVGIKARFDDNGYLHDDPVVARVGILHYRNADGTPRRELRLPEDVFRSDSLDAFAGMPITIGHRAMVNSKNHKQYGVGTCLGAARADGDNVRVPIVVQDDDAISQAKAKKIAGLSVGYRIDYEVNPGFYNEKTGEVKLDSERGDDKQEFIGKEWQRFDGIQRNIKPNHLALVRNGRAGTVARLNLDGDEDLDYDSPEPIKPEGKPMALIRLDSGADVEVDQVVADELNKVRATAKELKSRFDSAESKNTELQVKVDVLTEKAEAFPAQLEQARNDAAESIRQRAALVASAEKFGVKATDAMSDIEVKKAVVTKVHPQVNFDGKDDTYVNMRYDVALESEPTGIARQRLQTGIARKDGAESGGAASEARQNMINKAKGGK